MKLYQYELDKWSGKIEKHVDEVHETVKTYACKGRWFINYTKRINKDDLNKVIKGIYYFSLTPADDEAKKAFIDYVQEEIYKLKDQIKDKEKLIVEVMCYEICD